MIKSTKPSRSLLWLVAALLATCVFTKPEKSGGKLTVTERFERSPTYEKLCLKFSEASAAILDAFTLGK